MSPAVGFVPAWKRLGLKLAHFPDGNQSGDPVSGLDVPQSPEQRRELSGPRESNDDIRRAAATPPENVNLPSLGKRKTLDAPAEDDRHAFKKSKRGEEVSHGTAEDSLIAPSQEGTGPSDSILPTPSTSDKPKGDSNYRKKKTKGPRAPPKEKAALKHGSPNAQSAPARSPSPAEVNFADDGTTLLPSTEIDFLASDPAATTKRSKKTSRDTIKDIATSLDCTPPQTDRRKSVTFTPDTKTADGNSASNLFKKWVLDQKGADADFSAAEVAQFAPPPGVHPANGIPTSQGLTAKEEKEARKSEKKSKKKQKEISSTEPKGDEGAEKQPERTKSSAAAGKSATESNQETPNTSSKPTPKGKKKDPSVYRSYLSQYHNDRANWKFNKAKQNDVLDNALNIFRIPDEYLEALLEYTKGLKGANIVERLTKRCNTTLTELDEEEKKIMSTMDDAQVREAAKQEALDERLFKEKKRRQLDGDIESLSSHPYSEGFIRRLKRHRAEALLGALNLAAPIRPVPAPPPRRGVGQKVVFDDLGPSIAPKPVRKRKSRTDISSDSSSSDSSSSSESDSEDSDEETNSTSSSGSSSSDAESEDESGKTSEEQGSDSEDSSSNSKSGGSGSDDDEDSSNSSSDSD